MTGKLSMMTAIKRAVSPRPQRTHSDCALTPAHVQETPLTIFICSSFQYFVDLAIRRNQARDAYVTVKAARKVWRELAKNTNNEIMRSVPKEHDLSSNLSRILKLKCIPQTWITDSDGNRQNARSVFRRISLQFVFEGDVMIPREGG